MQLHMSTTHRHPVARVVSRYYAAVSVDHCDVRKISRGSAARNWSDKFVDCSDICRTTSDNERAVSVPLRCQVKVKVAIHTAAFMLNAKKKQSRCCILRLSRFLREHMVKRYFTIEECNVNH